MVKDNIVHVHTFTTKQLALLFAIDTLQPQLMLSFGCKWSSGKYRYFQYNEMKVKDIGRAHSMITGLKTKEF